MTLQCPRCPATLPDKFELYQHLRNVHKLSDNEAQKLSKSSGWYEQKTQTKDGDVAVDHREAMLRAQLQNRKPLDVPMMTTALKEDFKLPEGWSEGIDGEYFYEKEVVQIHNYDSTIEIIVKAKVMQSNGYEELHKIYRDLRELKKLEEKEIALSSRIAALVVSDPAFHEIARELYEVKNQIAWEKDSIIPEQETELLLEDRWGKDLEEADMQKAQQEFMNKVNAEYTRQKEKYKQKS